MSKTRRVFLYLTSECNLRCLHCYNRSGPKSPNELSTQNITRLLSEIRELDVEIVNFDGGEPFLRADILSLVDSALETGLRVQIVTNAMCLDSATLRRLENRLHRLTFSLNGPDANSHDRIRGHGSFNNTLDWIERALDHSLPVSILYVISRENVANPDSLLDVLDSRGLLAPIRFLCYFAPTKLGRACDNWDLFDVDPSTWRVYLQKMKTIAESTRRVGFELGIVPKESVDEFTASYRGCNIGERTMGYIGPTGDVSFCSLLLGSVWSLGNVRKAPFGEIWQDGDQWAQLEHRFEAATRSCIECAHLDICKGGCPALFQHGIGPDPRCLKGYVPFCPCFFYTHPDASEGKQRSRGDGS